jgi:hypothetical protein
VIARQWITVAVLTGSLVLATGPTSVAALAGPGPAGKAASWDRAAARLGMAGSLWEPARTVGLARSGRIDVIADNLTFGAGSVTSGDTFAGSRYGTRARGFAIAEKWAVTGWAAEPSYTTSMARVGIVRIGLGLPGTRILVRAEILANCFAQPADKDPRPIPRGFRCTRADVLRTGGVLRMTARPASTMTAPGDTSVVITSSGLTYAQLISIAHGLQQVAGSAADGAGSAQMVAMCGQMSMGAMTPDQAQAFAAANGYATRVGSVDGQPQAVTMDYRPDRFTLAIAAGTVTSCTYG